MRKSAVIVNWLRDGWVRYEHRPEKHTVRFNESLDLITNLLGSNLYEWKYEHGWYLIKRVSQ